MAKSGHSVFGGEVRIVLGVDEFDETQIARLEAVAAGWATIERIPMIATPDQWRNALASGPGDVAIGWPPADEIAASEVKLVQLGSSGWDAYAGRGLEARGIALCNARGVYSAGVAEHAVGMMMALVRRIPEYTRDKESRVFRRHPPYPDEIEGSTAAVVGIGDIGQAIAKRCRALGMRVIGVTRRQDGERPSVDEMRAASSAEALGPALADADHVFLTMPGSAENVGLMSAEVMDCLKPSARLYNVSRGTTVDEVALVERLRDGRLRGAGLDVTAVEPLPDDSPLWTLGDNLLITGHSGGVSQRHPERFCQLIVRNLGRFRRGEQLENRVL